MITLPIEIQIVPQQTNSVLDAIRRARLGENVFVPPVASSDGAVMKSFLFQVEVIDVKPSGVVQYAPRQNHE